jgi:cytochrome P450
VRYSIAAGHRLPSIFAEPDRFDPDRFAPPREEDKKHPYALVTFGGGPRTCIGVNMAQVEVRALTAHVLRRYTISPDPQHRPVQVGVITGFPEHGIRVNVSPRQA